MEGVVRCGEVDTVELKLLAAMDEERCEAEEGKPEVERGRTPRREVAVQIRWVGQKEHDNTSLVLVGLYERERRESEC